MLANDKNCIAYWFISGDKDKIKEHTTAIVSLFTGTNM